MAGRAREPRWTGAGRFARGAGLAGLSLAAAALSSATAPSVPGAESLAPAAAARTAEQDGAAPAKPSKLAEFERLELALLEAAAEDEAAARDALIAWIEALEAATLAAGVRDDDALSALHYGAQLLAQRADQAARRDAWWALAERAERAVSDADRRRHFHTGLLVTRAQDLLGRGEDARAREELERALAEDPAPVVVPHALQALSEIQRRAGEKLDALASLDRAAEAIAKLGPALRDGPEAGAQVELMRAQAQMDLGLPDLAWASLVRCKELARAAQSAQTHATATLIEINLMLATNRAQQVIDLLERAPAEGSAPEKSRGAAPELGSALRLRLGLALLDPGCLTEESAPRGVALLEGVLAEAGLPPDERYLARIALVDHHVRRRDFDAAGDQLAGAREELARLQQHGGAPRAREEVETEAYAAHIGRSRAGRVGAEDPRGGRAGAEDSGAARDAGSDAGAGREQLARLRASYGRLIEQLRGQERPRGGVGFLHFAARRFMLNELIELSVAVEGAGAGFEHAIDALIEAQRQGSLARALGDSACTAAEALRATAGDDGGVLVFLPDHHRTLVLAWDARRGGLVSRVAPQNVWRPAVDAWLHALATPPGGLAGKALERNLAAIERHGAAVADLLLRPEIRERIADWKSLTLVGADAMSGLPFEALPHPVAGTLGTRTALARAPSLPVAVQLARRSAAPPAGGLWLVAAPEMPDWAAAPLRALPAIPCGESEMLALARPYPKAGSAWFAGERATRAALEDPKLAGARVLQITAHGVEVAGKERPAALALRPASRADDGLLDCDEVEALRVPDTVVLSACSTARGELRFGEDGLNHLGGAFHLAGASCVVLSAQPVEAQAMQALLEVFHARVCAGDSRAEALRAARAALAADPRFAHPFYRSFVQASGSSRRAR